MGLRKGQKELVEQYRAGYCGVPAIPGGGKTYCLTMWVCEMISQGIHKPGKILIVTYMNSAVNNFKQRINEELKKRGITSTRDYQVTTIHGFCLQIVREKPDLVMADEEFDIIDGVRRNQIITNAIDEWKKDNYEAFNFYINDSNMNANMLQKSQKDWQKNLCSIMGSLISEFKSKSLTPSQLKEKCKGLENTSITKWASDIYAIYDKKMKISGLFDFDDMLQNALKLLQTDDDLLKKYREKYTFICEDEAQDSNYIQNQILQLIAGESGNFLRVGDSNQSITSTFANSDFRLFRDFCAMPQTKIYNITQSSRSTENIIKLANYFVDYVTERHPVEECRNSLLKQYIEPVADDDEYGNPRIDGYGIQAGIFSSWQDEVRGVADKVQEFVRKYPDKTIAVLAPNSYTVDDFVKILKSRGIAYEELDNESEERNAPIRKLGKTVDFIATPEDNEKFSRFVSEVILAEYRKDQSNQGNIEELAAFIEKYPVEKLLYPIGGAINKSEIPENILKNPAWQQLMDNTDMIRQMLEFPITIVEKLILFIAEKLRFNKEERAIAQKVASDVKYLMSQNPRWRLSDLAVELNNPKNIFNFFAGIVWELKGYKPKPGVVTLATYHKSKGLEWDAVFLTHLNYDDFPAELSDKFKGEYWFLKDEYKNPLAIAKAEFASVLGNKPADDIITASKIETIAERARLLYVGITRAEEYLFLSAYHPNTGRRNDSQPSKYILELKKYIEEASA